MEFANLLIAILIIRRVHSQQFAGDPCFHKTHSKNGICKPVGECPSAIEELIAQKVPQICSFDGTVPVACCPEDAPPTTPTTTTTTSKPKIVEKPPVGIGAKSYEKCREFAKHVYVIRERPTLSGFSKNETINVCGVKHVKLIVGGTLAEGKEFPHMAAIGYDLANNTRAYFCGGSLISRNYILTAGHCLEIRNLGVAKYVRVGDLQLNVDTDDADTQELNIIERIPHPYYRPPSHYNDIALLKVEKDFDITPYVRPICLNYERNLPDEKAMASGWGDTSYIGNSSEALLKVTLDFFSHEQCTNYFQVNERKLARGLDDNMQMCAGSISEKKDSCQGDSGGPLQIYHSSVYCMYKLVGVTSFGKSCGSMIPGIYIRVSHYIPWIEEIVWP